MTGIIAVEFHDKAGISRSCSAHILTYGNVKDMHEQLSFERSNGPKEPEKP
ncbi:hypothetical protein J2X47_001270 [Sphingomonas sp. BE270]|jgi:hypothetical protein|nr:hypothetical protein [Sphingomonas sp. BE137]MDR7257099.1 hypothetical protein [Sphingomonas sp. BE270]